MKQKTSSTRALIDLLQRTSPLAWYKYGPDRNDPVKLARPPLVVWRFEKTPENRERVDGIEQVMAEAIRKYCGEVQWFLAPPAPRGCNWALWTKRCQEQWASGGDNIGVDARTVIQNSDPDHGIVANKDLYGLVDFLAAALAAYKFSEMSYQESSPSVQLA